MLAQVRIPMLGLIENMSYLIAPQSGERIDVFGRRAAASAPPTTHEHYVFRRTCVGPGSENRRR